MFRESLFLSFFIQNRELIFLCRNPQHSKKRICEKLTQQIGTWRDDYKINRVVNAQNLLSWWGGSHSPTMRCQVQL